jgi:hypothetical protein
MFRFVVALAALLAPAAAFAPRASRALTRRSGISMSHFSTVQTQLKNKELLVKSLKDVNVNVIVAEHETMAVRGYQGETVQAEIAIQQDNGQDIGFRFNGQSYEMVADLQFWGQTMPVESFLEKVTQRYSVNAVLESAAEGGFSTNSFVTNQETGTVEIELSRYVM